MTSYIYALATDHGVVVKYHHDKVTVKKRGGRILAIATSKEDRRRKLLVCRAKFDTARKRRREHMRWLRRVNVTAQERSEAMFK